MILFALICGYLPFEDANTSNLYKKILSGDFKIPKFVSEPAKDMIRSILNTNPEQRYRVADIRRHSWYTSDNLPRITGGIFIGLSQIPINKTILEKLMTLGFKKDHVLKCINANKHNHITTSYYLELKRAEQEGLVDETQFEFYDDRRIAQIHQERLAQQPSLSGQALQPEETVVHKASIDTTKHNESTQLKAIEETASGGFSMTQPLKT